jgi:zinc transporter ZupT
MNATAAKEMPTRLVAVISAVAPPFSGSMRSPMIAFGIGVHNFGEGLAIGSAYAAGEIALGALLLLGFTIHNTTARTGAKTV